MSDSNAFLTDLLCSVDCEILGRSTAESQNDTLKTDSQLSNHFAESNDAFGVRKALVYLYRMQFLIFTQSWEWSIFCSGSYSRKLECLCLHRSTILCSLNFYNAFYRSLIVNIPQTAAKADEKNENKKKTLCTKSSEFDCLVRQWLKHTLVNGRTYVCMQTVINAFRWLLRAASDFSCLNCMQSRYSTITPKPIRM